MNRELLKKNFEGHKFITSFFDTGKEAAEYLCGQMKNTTVGFGGSMTLTGMNLQELLEKEGNTVYNHATSKDQECTHKARNARFFICSANGVSETGEMVNIDGTGNRVSATLFGPEKVFFVVGKNKIVPTLQDAIDRARNIASPPNCVRLHRNTPCAAAAGGDMSKAVKCFDCNSSERICNAIVLYLRPMNHMEVEVVFVDEELGY